MGRPAASLCLLLIALLAAGPALSASGAPDAPSVVKRELIRESARLSDLGQAAARDALARAFEVPVTEADVLAALSRAMVENGSSEYVAGFEAIVASGPASAIPHGDPSDDAANLILPGEVVVVDIGARYKGWVSDNTKTYFMGPNPPEEFVEIYGVVKEAQTLASAAVQSGALARDLDSLARTFIDSKGYGEFFIHCLGHGVGLYVHVPPMLCPDSDDVLITARNDVVAVEPGVYLEGCFGIRIEDDFAVLRTGPERYTFAPSELEEILIAPPALWNGSSPSGEFADFSGCAFAVDPVAAAGGRNPVPAAPPGSQAGLLWAAGVAASAGAVLAYRFAPVEVKVRLATAAHRPAARLAGLRRR